MHLWWVSLLYSSEWQVVRPSRAHWCHLLGGIDISVEKWHAPCWDVFIIQQCAASSPILSCPLVPSVGRQRHCCREMTRPLLGFFIIQQCAASSPILSCPLVPSGRRQRHRYMQWDQNMSTHTSWKLWRISFLKNVFIFYHTYLKENCCPKILTPWMIFAQSLLGIIGIVASRLCGRR